MKIAITGHCDGIGKAIYDKLADKGHELIGFDIADESGDILNGREEILEKSKDCDVFINNAFHMTGAQTDMFNDIYELWKNERKQIINICSASKHYPSIFNSGLHFNYIAKKKVLWKNIVSKFKDTLNKEVQLRIHTVSPGLVATAMTKDLEDETIKLETYLKQISKMAREQFSHKALAKKAFDRQNELVIMNQAHR